MLRSVTPQLRIADWASSRRFYVDGLGFSVEWEHRFEPSLPVFVKLTRDGVALFLSEHRDDCEFGGAAYFDVDDVDSLHGLLRTRGFEVEPPRNQPWGRREMMVVDEDGNRLRFANEAIAAP